MSITDLPPSGLFHRGSCDLAEFRAIVEQPDGEFDLAERVDQGVPVYAAERLRGQVLADGSDRPVRDLLAQVLHSGPGIFVITGAFEDEIIDRATAAFEEMIEQQHAEGRAVGDHYAKPGANDRVWNTIEKLALADPDTFVDYYSNDMVALASLAWLGPGYQISSQINVVNPGGEAQSPHRDYHLGFMTLDEAESFPAHTHLLSPMLTLQAAVAHCDMPVASGPTMYLPHSQKYPLGYLAWRDPEFIEYFRERRTQLAVAKGDFVVFNPALFHAAGSNQTTDIKRMANLMQVSSAMGRALESMDRIAMSTSAYAALRQRVVDGWPDHLVVNAATAAADGYAFPTNLDRDPPLGGLTPPSHLDLLLESLRDGDTSDQFEAKVDALVERRRSH